MAFPFSGRNILIDIMGSIDIYFRSIVAVDVNWCLFYVNCNGLTRPAVFIPVSVAKTGTNLNATDLPPFGRNGFCFPLIHPWALVTNYRYHLLLQNWFHWISHSHIACRMLESNTQDVKQHTMDRCIAYWYAPYAYIPYTYIYTLLLYLYYLLQVILFIYTFIICYKFLWGDEKS